jgi:hypothetical protein
MAAKLVKIALKEYLFRNSYIYIELHASLNLKQKKEGILYSYK